MENEFFKNRLNITRRHFFGKAAAGIGGLALGSLLIPKIWKGDGTDPSSSPLGIAQSLQRPKGLFIYVKMERLPSMKPLIINPY